MRCGNILCLVVSRCQNKGIYIQNSTSICLVGVLRQAVPEFIEGQGPVKSWELELKTENRVHLVKKKCLF